MKKLADELGISSVITDETLKRIEKNLGKILLEYLRNPDIRSEIYSTRN
jgi:predicted DNA binding protein